MIAEVGHYAIVFFALIQSVLSLTDARVPHGALMAVAGHRVSR
jgi:hypothetical protein